MADETNGSTGGGRRAEPRDPLLVVEDLQKHFPIRRGVFRTVRGHVRAVDGISFTIPRGSTMALVGESGCGKTTAARAILRLEEPTGGRVVFDGREVAALDREGLRRFRRRAQIIFQDPFSSLNPRMTVGGALREVLKVHGIVGPGRVRDRVAELLEAVGLHADDARKYPHEFSGGQRQRVGIARALAVQPDLVIADEPVSALDVSVKAQILNLLVDLQEEFDLTYLIISHDLSVVRHMADRVAVLYLGRIVELADTETLFRQPQHPYTRALLSAIPEPRPDADRPRILLPGDVPDPADPPDGCPFHPRCPHPDVDHVCETVRPGLERKRGGGLAACHKAESRPDGGRVEQA